MEKPPPPPPVRVDGPSAEGFIWPKISQAPMPTSPPGPDEGWNRWIRAQTGLKHGEIDFALRLQLILGLLKNYRTRCLHQRRELRRLNREREVRSRATQAALDHVIGLLATAQATSKESINVQKSTQATALGPTGCNQKGSDEADE